VPEIDAEHRTIFEKAGELHRAVLAGKDIAEIQALLKELIARASRHFTHEEEMMRAAGYPSYEWHKGQHDSIRAKVKSAERRLRRGETDGTLELLKYLSGWLKNHTSVTDRLMSAYCRNHAWRNAAMAS
jgi:hemerythrin